MPLDDAMKIAALLTPELVVHPLRATDKWDVIRQLTRAAVDAGALPESMFDEVHEALVTRERSMTTGMEHGIAIPHAAVDGIDEVIALVAIAPDGVPFETLDSEPARIIVCLVIPREKKLLHIKTLAEIAKLLGDPELRDKLLATRTPEDVVGVVRARSREFA